MVFTATANATSEPNTTYAFVALIGDADDPVTLKRVSSNNEDSGAAAGWSIADRFRFFGSSLVWAPTTSGRAYVIAVKGTSAVSTDATLSGLELEDGNGNGITLDPVFAPGTTSYTAAVVNRIDTVTLTATKNEDDATVAITDDDDAATPGEAEFSLVEGENIIEVVVTAEDGITTSTYTITATRATLPLAPTDCPSDTDWCATLRVGYTVGDAFFQLATYGYDYATNLGDLSSNTFSYNGLIYEAIGLFRRNYRRR